ncbi:cytosine permease [Anaerobacillus sp. CMMVII]|uniref:purine-cytosine permease family protein n=1 Tax=Anaerobacillus sp. CMMVII TaxID=2755588 RepID=UPI0021B7F5B6|nr:cytosine permease [Anaerobacillus sp. CMMVII]MCT8138105.1 cytosine permease [Anaerobacillus sp. CMMVII]
MGEAVKTIEKRTVVERFGLEAVPLELRTTTAMEYSMIQIAISVNAGNFLVPALAVLEGGLSFSYAVLSTVIGAAFAFLFVSFLALPGAKYGIPAQYAIRSIMGIKGARYVASPIRTLTSLYWFSVQTIGGTYLLKELIERFFGYQVPFIPIALVMATIMAILALIGFDAVKKITKYFLPILFLGGIVMLFIFITSTEAGMTFKDVLTKEGSNQIGTVVFFASLAFVQYVSGVSSASDMARYGKTPKQAFTGLYFGNVIGFTITAVLGAYTAALAGSWNPYVISSQLTDSTLFISIIFVATIASMISINLSNAYTGGYSLLNSIPRLGRVKSALIFGLAAISLSAFPTLVNDAKLFISLLGAFIIPLSAVIVSDFLFIKRRVLTEVDFERLGNESYQYNTSGFICIGIGMMFYFILPESLSPGFLTFIITSACYLLIRLFSFRLLLK